MRSLSKTEVAGTRRTATMSCCRIDDKLSVAAGVRNMVMCSAANLPPSAPEDNGTEGATAMLTGGSATVDIILQTGSLAGGRILRGGGFVGFA